MRATIAIAAIGGAAVLALATGSLDGLGGNWFASPGLAGDVGLSQTAYADPWSEPPPAETEPSLIEEPASQDEAAPSEDESGASVLEAWACESALTAADLADIGVEEECDQSYVAADGFVMLSFDSDLFQRSFVLGQFVEMCGVKPGIAMFEGGATETVQLFAENILEKENGCELSREADLESIALWSANGSGSGWVGIRCKPYWTPLEGRARWCFWQYGDGRVRFTNERFWNGHWVVIYDSGIIDPHTVLLPPPEN